MKQEVNFAVSENTKLVFNDEKQTSNLLFSFRQIGYIEALPPYYNHKEGFPEFFVAYVIEGAISIFFENIEHIVKAGQAFIIDSRKSITVKNCFGAMSKFYFVFATGSMAVDYYKKYREENDVVANNAETIKSCFESAISFINKENANSPQSSGCIHAIMASFAELSKSKRELPSGIRPAIMAIEKDPFGDITVESLSSLCSISPYHFIRKFKQATGKTPIKYANAIRAKIVLDYLENHEESLEDVAEHFGFKERRILSALIKRTYGINPIKLRQLKK